MDVTDRIWLVTLLLWQCNYDEFCSFLNNDLIGFIAKITFGNTLGIETLYQTRIKYIWKKIK